MFFFFNDTATTEIYTLSLHDALPISSAEHGDAWLSSRARRFGGSSAGRAAAQDLADEGLSSGRDDLRRADRRDRKSTRLNSSHANISYAVFCLKKKKNPHKSKE